MKPKKTSPAAPWTLEDVAIWRRFRLHPLVLWHYVNADRADAAVMHRIGVSGQMRIDLEDGFCVWLLPSFTWFTGYVYPDDLTDCA